MRRRRFVALAAGALAATLVRAQKADRLPRIGLLWIHAQGDDHYLKAFREGLAALGYVDGRNVRIDERFLVDRYDGLAAAAARLNAENVDVIVAYGTTAMQAAHKATSRIPIVVVASGDPVKAGVAASLARPGGNVTGFSTISQDMSGKRLEILKEMLPSANRIAVLLYPGSQSEVDSLRNYEIAARKLNLELRVVEIRAPSDIDPAIARIPDLKVDAALAVGSTMFVAERNRMVAAMAKIRLPALYSSLSIAQAGGLVFFGTDVTGNFRRVAIYIDKVIKGAKPADLPIEQPTKLDLVINLKTAKALGLKIPQQLLLRADRVIE